MKRFLGMGLAVSALLLFAAAPALAGVIVFSQFNANVNPDGTVTSDPSGPNTGWSPTGGPGEFIKYPITGEVSWWNQWFYNDPMSWERQKWIEYLITITPVDIAGGPDVIEVALNWSTPGYPPNPGVPPLEDPDGTLIERHTIFNGPVDPSGTIVLDSRELEPPDGKYWILPFNPEWVSIDIRVLDPVGGVDVIDVYGDVTHQCVPEPATLLMLGLGALALLFTRRSR